MHASASSSSSYSTDTFESVDDGVERTTTLATNDRLAGRPSRPTKELDAARRRMDFADVGQYHSSNGGSGTLVPSPVHTAQPRASNGSSSTKPPATSHAEGTRYLSNVAQVLGTEIATVDRTNAKHSRKRRGKGKGQSQTRGSKKITRKSSRLKGKSRTKATSGLSRRRVPSRTRMKGQPANPPSRASPKPEPESTQTPRRQHSQRVKRSHRVASDRGASGGTEAARLWSPNMQPPQPSSLPSYQNLKQVQEAALRRADSAHRSPRRPPSRTGSLTSASVRSAHRVSQPASGMTPANAAAADSVYSLVWQAEEAQERPQTAPARSAAPHVDTSPSGAADGVMVDEFLAAPAPSYNFDSTPRHGRSASAGVATNGSFRRHRRTASATGSPRRAPTIEWTPEMRAKAKELLDLLEKQNGTHVETLPAKASFYGDPATGGETPKRADSRRLDMLYRDAARRRKRADDERERRLKQVRQSCMQGQLRVHSTWKILTVPGCNPPPPQSCTFHPQLRRGSSVRKASTTDDGVIPLEQQLEAGARLYRDAVRRTRERHEQEQQLERTASRDAVFRKDPTPAYLRKQVRARMSTKKEQGGATAQSPVQPAPPSRTRRTGPKAVSPRARKVSPRASRGGRAQSSANATSRRAQPVRRRTDRRTDRRASAASATSECSTATGPSTAADPAEEPSSPPGNDMRLDREYLASLPFMKRLQAYDKIRKLVRACVCACVLSQPVLCCPWRM